MLFTLLVTTTILTVSNAVKTEKIIIIGAGASGIAAGTKLLENGVNNFIILEAEDRIGGRVNTIDVDGKKIDLGAQWCHGQKGNIVYETLEKKNLLNLLHEDEVDSDFYLSSTEPLDHEFSEDLFGRMIKYTDNVTLENSNQSLGTILEKLYHAEISDKYKNDPKKLRIAKLGKNTVEHSVLSLESAFSWYDINATSTYEDCDGSNSLSWNKNGYKIYLDIMMKKYPNPSEQLPIDDKINLNKEVTKIVYTDDNDVRVLCSDKSEYIGKHVIFTPSVGVLKADSEKLFEPKLSEEKSTAIKRIGLGAVLKIYVEYDTKWWGNNSNFNLIWTEEDKKAINVTGPKNKKGESWIADFFIIWPIPDSNIILIWGTGELVPILENLDEDIIKEGVEYTLNLFLGHLFNIPHSKKIIRSNWYSNPHFRGTWTYAHLGQTPEDMLNLQKPIIDKNGQPIILFGGEATNPIHHGTVHGAIESGYREANRIIEIYKK